jgi:hypothetical protein
MTNTQSVADEFFATIPDDLLIEMATNNWGALRKVCIALTLDLQMIEEQEERKKLKN